MMKAIRTILADDERVGRSRLRRMLEKEADIEIVAECDSGHAALEAVLAHAPELLFLDINMPGMDGFDVLDALGPERQPGAVIFVTAYDAHAVRAFDACALDYLLKPASPERLGKALGRARERIRNRVAYPSATLPPAIAAVEPANAPPQRFIVRGNGRLLFIAPEEIDWVEAAGNYTILHVGSFNHMIRETMSGMEAQLASDTFVRVSRSAIVNLRQVRELSVSAGNENAAILRNGHRIPFTRSLREVADRLRAL